MEEDWNPPPPSHALVGAELDVATRYRHEDFFNPASPTTHKELGMSTTTFGPGDLGIHLDMQGKVTKVGPGQAQEQGIQLGMRCQVVDGRTYTPGLLRQKMTGKQEYKVIFFDAEVATPIKGKAPRRPPQVLGNAQGEMGEASGSTEAAPDGSNAPPADAPGTETLKSTGSPRQRRRPKADHERVLSLTTEFAPGNIGLSLDANGRVTKVDEEGQGKKAGVAVGMQCQIIGGSQAFHPLHLRAKTTGEEAYKLTFLAAKASPRRSARSKAKSQSSTTAAENGALEETLKPSQEHVSEANVKNTKAVSELGKAYSFDTKMLYAAEPHSAVLKDRKASPRLMLAGASAAGVGSAARALDQSIQQVAYALKGRPVVESLNPKTTTFGTAKLVDSSSLRSLQAR